jgi:hypothetical protein
VNVVIRPVHDRFVEDIVFPALALGVVDAAAGLSKLREDVADERPLWILDRVLDRHVDGSFFGLVDDDWLELIHLLLFAEWERRPDGWRIAREPPGYAASDETALHVTLMVQDPGYPHGDRRAAERYRESWLASLSKTGPAALVAGIWDPFPSFPPDQVLVTVGRSTYAPAENLAIADWSYRSGRTVVAWARKLPDQLGALLQREQKRLGKVAIPEYDELLSYWLGNLPAAPTLSVAFSGLGPEGASWVREVGELARLIRDAARAGHGLTSLVTRVGGQVTDPVT